VAQLGAVFTDPAYADVAATVPAFTGSHKWYVGEIVSLDGQYYVALGESAGNPNENIESPADPDYGWGKWEPISTGGVKVTVLGEAVTVSAEGDAAAPVAVTLPEAVDVAKLTTMAIAQEDETYAPVPTRVDEDGGVTVLVRGEVALVPLNVEAAFPDTDLGEAYANVTAEIDAAAAKMIVNGRESGAFDPAARVTTQEAAIMFLRAMGVPVQPLTAMDTGAEQGLVAADAAPTAPVTRGDTAVLVANALAALGLEQTLDDGEADELLADFSDVSGLSAEQRDALALCVKLGILTGYGGAKAGQIGANDALQRSQMASITVRLQGLYWE
jgi:hypothetical protein